MAKPALNIRVFLAAVLLAGLLAALGACERKTDAAVPPPRPSRLTPEPAATQPTEQARKEVPPPSVKIKRDKEGVYTWDITGKDVGAILEADRALRRRLAAPADKGEKP